PHPPLPRIQPPHLGRPPPSPRTRRPCHRGVPPRQPRKAPLRPTLRRPQPRPRTRPPRRDAQDPPAVRRRRPDRLHLRKRHACPLRRRLALVRRPPRRGRPRPRAHLGLPRRPGQFAGAAGHGLLARELRRTALVRRHLLPRCPTRRRRQLHRHPSRALLGPR